MTFSAIALCPGSPLADLHNLIRSKLKPKKEPK